MAAYSSVIQCAKSPSIELHVKLVILALLSVALAAAQSQPELERAEAAASRTLESNAQDAAALSRFGTLEAKIAADTRNAVDKAERLRQARQAFEKALRIDPNLVEAHNGIAALVIGDVTLPLLRARIASLMMAGEPGPIRDEHQRAELRERYGKSLEDAIAHSQKALQVSPNDRTALSQIYTLFTMRASLAPSNEAYEADMKTANEWRRKELRRPSPRHP